MFIQIQTYLFDSDTQTDTHKQPVWIEEMIDVFEHDASILPVPIQRGHNNRRVHTVPLKWYYDDRKGWFLTMVVMMMMMAYGIHINT